MTKIMNLMKIRIHFFKDMANHTYFFQDPAYQDAMTEKFLTKLKQSDETKVSILSDLDQVLSHLPEFDSSSISKGCSHYLKETGIAKGFKNDDVFQLLRFAITGNPVGAPVGEICEIVGKETSLQRIKSAERYLKSLDHEKS